MPISKHYGLSSVQGGDRVLQSVATDKQVFIVQASRAIVRIDGIQYVPDAVNIEINAHGATNTATVTLPISSNGDFSQSLFKSADSVNVSGNANLYNGKLTLAQAQALTAGENTDYQPIYVEIYGTYVTNSQLLDPAVLHPGQMTSVYQGYLDKYTATLETDKIVFAVRSLAAPLADTKITAVSMNQTIVSFIAEQCAKAGIPVQFDLPKAFVPVTVAEVLGKELVGGSQSNINNALYGKSMWDLAKQGSVFDDTDLWEDSAKGILHYSVPSAITRTPAKFVWYSTIETATLEHAITQSKKIQVEVRTYTRRNTSSAVTRVAPDGTVTNANTQSSSSIIPGTASTVSTSTGKKGTTTKIKTSTGDGGGSFGSKSGEGKTDYNGIDVYPFYFPGLKPERVTSLAKGLWRQISMHQYLATLGGRMTADLLKKFSITSVMNLSNFMYQGWNSTFYPRRIVLDYAKDTGWKYNVEAATDPGPPGTV